jgi:glycosyltransferase involved in cell wall biosynthesis
MENSPKLLTVIIITFNHESSIAEALSSVLEQETIYPYEIWVSDDCSTDATLSICNEYQKKYPDRIKIFSQASNTLSDPTKVFHFASRMKSVTTKYVCALDGDDSWCDKAKIQTALNFLENHPEYYIFADDTLYVETENNNKNSWVHEILQIDIHNPVKFTTAPYFPTSSRVYRNVTSYPEKMSFSDIFIYYWYLDKGPLYYYDKVMSVYNYSGKGVWSRLNVNDRNELDYVVIGELNVFFSYKYDWHFTRCLRHPLLMKALKRMVGKDRAWKTWLSYRYFKCNQIYRKNYSNSYPKHLVHQ